jgi:hypothetical protein
MSESDGERERDGRQSEAEAEAGSADDKARLRADIKATLVELAGLQVEIERLATCRHSRESARNGICGECGAEVW